MWRAPPGSMLGGVKKRTITISLELRVDGDTVSGLATDQAGATAEFAGWLGLVSALDTLVSEPSLPAEPGRDLAVSTHSTRRDP
jgi:hypothetical protein